MNKYNKYRKQLQELGEYIGLTDETILTEQINPITKKQSTQLINNNRRFVKGMLKLSQSEQLFRINRIKAAVAEQKDAHKAFTEMPKLGE